MTLLDQVTTIKAYVLVHSRAKATSSITPTRAAIISVICTEQCWGKVVYKMTVIVLRSACYPSRQDF